MSSCSCLTSVGSSLESCWEIEFGHVFPVVGNLLCAWCVSAALSSRSVQRWVKTPWCSQQLSSFSCRITSHLMYLLMPHLNCCNLCKILFFFPLLSSSPELRLCLSPSFFHSQRRRWEHWTAVFLAESVWLNKTRHGCHPLRGTGIWSRSMRELITLWSHWFRSVSISSLRISLNSEPPTPGGLYHSKCTNPALVTTAAIALAWNPLGILLERSPLKSSPFKALQPLCEWRGEGWGAWAER